MNGGVLLSVLTSERRGYGGLAEYYRFASRSPATKYFGFTQPFHGIARQVMPNRPSRLGPFTNDVTQIPGILDPLPPCQYKIHAISLPFVRNWPTLPLSADVICEWPLRTKFITLRVECRTATRTASLQQMRRQRMRDWAI